MITTRTALALVLAVIAVLTGCVPVEDNRRTGPSPRPEARSMVDGVETWDLTGEPREALFGIEPDLGAGIFESGEPRHVALLLPDGVRVQTQAKVLAFRLDEVSGKPTFGFGLRGASVAPDELIERLRMVTEQLGVLDESATALAEFGREVADAPPGQTESVEFSSASATLGALRLNISAELAPIAGFGRLIIGGSWGQR